jgi:hypothetical protein
MDRLLFDNAMAGTGDADNGCRSAPLSISCCWVGDADALRRCGSQADG